MKKVIGVVMVLSLLLLLSSCMGNTEASYEDFENLMEKSSLEELENNGKVMSYTSEGKYSITYTMCGSDEEAKELFDDTSSNLLLKYGDKNAETQRVRLGGNYDYTVKYDKNFFRVIKKGRTIVTVESQIEYEDEIKSTLKEIGY